MLALYLADMQRPDSITCLIQHQWIGRMNNDNTRGPLLSLRQRQDWILNHL